MIFKDFDNMCLIDLREMGTTGRFVNMMGDEYEVDRLSGYAVRKSPNQGERV